MIKLNLEAKSKAYELIKQYLEENVSETLADKINNGVRITKDNKTLINKKDLNGFWQFATEEARKTAEKGAKGAAVDDATVYGWAIHYFEEDSIEGKLYNEDGTEYKPTAPKTAPKVETKPQTKKSENSQPTLFDLFPTETSEQQNNKEDIEPDEKVDDEETEEIEKEYEQEQEKIEEKVEPQKVQIVETSTEKVVVDTDTGEVLSDEQIKKSFDKETMYMLYTILDGKMDMR